MRRSIFVITAVLALACVDEPEGRDAVLAPRSLADTQPDGSLSLDAQGKFSFDEQARLRFDYFLTADEELSPEQLDAWVQAELASQLPDHAQADAIAAWHAYLSYREQAAAALTDTQAEFGELEQRLLRTVAAEFGDAPIATLERDELTRAFQLSRALDLQPQARERALAELGIRPGVGELGGDAAAFLAGRQAVEQAASQGASAEQLHALRSEQFGPEAAERLAALDAKRAAWDARVEGYRGERAQLEQGFVGSLTALEDSVEALAATHFSASERRRLRALEQR
jgi:lipase chaperone LimK